VSGHRRRLPARRLTRASAHQGDPAANKEAKQSGEELIATLEKEALKTQDLWNNELKLEQVEIELAKSKYGKLTPATEEYIKSLARTDRQEQRKQQADQANDRGRGGAR
jgi:hypothetical protein